MLKFQTDNLREINEFYVKEYGFDTSNKTITNMKYCYNFFSISYQKIPDLQLKIVQ